MPTWSRCPSSPTGPGEITAGDLEVPAGVEILNPDAPIATLEKKTKLEMYLTLGRGRGYSPAEDNKTEDQPIGVIPIDSIFSPIKRASYRVDSSRVGQRTDFDKLSLLLETDGSIEPGAALREAAELMIASLAIFTDADRVEELTQTNGAEPEAAEEAGAAGGGDDRLIEELEIGVRAYNCLKRAGVQTIGDLQAKSESELKAIPNFGERSIEEVIEAMHGLGLASTRRVASRRRIEDRNPATMRHKKNRHKLSRDSAHRKSLMKNLSRQLFEHERIQTSQAKAKAVKPEVDP